MTKTCTVCHQEKPLDRFAPSKGYKFVVNSRCRDCRNAYQRDFWQKNLEKSRAVARENSNRFRENNKEKVRQWKRRYREENLETIKAKDAAYRKTEASREAQRRGATKYYQNNKEKCIKASLDYATRNKDKLRAAARKWQEKNKEHIAQRRRRWLKEKPHLLRATEARRRAAEKKALASWANNFFISEIYHLAKLRSDLTGVKHCVDHIVPLQSRKVCGLHVEHNLRVIPLVSNSSKGNRVWPDMPGAVGASA